MGCRAEKVRKEKRSEILRQMLLVYDFIYGRIASLSPFLRNRQHNSWKPGNSDKSANNRHTEIKNSYIAFKRHNKKVRKGRKRVEPLLASNQHSDKQRFTSGLTPDNQVINNNPIKELSKIKDQH